MDDEAGLIGKFADDFDGDGGRVPDAIAVVGAVGIGPPASVVFTLWLSMTAADGIGSRPVRTRSI